MADQNGSDLSFEVDDDSASPEDLTFTVEDSAADSAPIESTPKLNVNKMWDVAPNFNLPSDMANRVHAAGTDVATEGPFYGAKAFVTGGQSEEERQAEFDKLYESQKPYDSGLDAVKNVAVTGLHSLFDAFSSLQAMTLGPISRIMSAADEGISALPADRLDKSVHGLLNPSYIQEMRKRNSLPPEFSDAWNEVSKQGPLAQTSFLLQEAFPLQAQPADLGFAMKQVEDTVALVEDPDLKNVVRAAGRFSYNFGLDLTSYITLGMLPIIKGLSKTTQAAEAGKEIDLATALIRSEMKMPGSKTLEQLAKERGLIRLRFPFVKKEFPIYNGDGMARVLDETRSFFQAKTPIAKLSQKVGMEAADATNTWYSFLKASAQSRLDKTAEFFKNSPMTKDYNVMKYASDIAQHGEEFGPSVYRATGGVALTEAQLKEVPTIQKFVSKAYEDALDFFEKTTGRKVVRVGSQDIRNLEIPEGMDALKYELKVGDKTYNYMYQNAYGFGRRMRPDLNLQMANASGREFDAVTSSFGLKTSASSLKQRVNLSDAAAEDYMRGQHGVEYFYDKNMPQIIFDKTAELYHLAIDTGYVQNMKKAYGVPLEEIGKSIQAANIRVNMARLKGTVPLMEDLTISKMSPSDFKRIDNQAFDTMKYVVGKDEAGLLIQKDLYYPKQVADSINAKFSRPSENSLAKGLAWYSNSMAKNLISGSFRLPRQAVDNIFRGMSANMKMGSLVRESSISLMEAKTGKLSELSKEMALIPSMNETITHLGDFKGPFKINSTILKNEEILNLPNAYIDSVHALAQENKSTLKEWVTAGKKIANFPVDNPLSKFMRSMGNASDVITKRAYYRQLRESGYNPVEAVEAVNNVFMDFTATSTALRKMRYINPFISFQMKNMESMVKLAFNAPIMMQTLNPYRGYLRRAIEESAGWDPVAARHIQDEIPALRDGALSFVLRGTKDIEGDVSEARKFANAYYLNGLSQEEQEKFLDRGGVINLRWYDPMQGTSDFLDPTRLNENMYAPLTTAAVMAIAGYDTFKQKYIESVGSGFEGRDKIVEALKVLNPADYKNFYSVVGQGMRMAGEFTNKLFSDPLDEDSRKRLELRDDDKFASLLKHNERLGRFMSQAKFLGLGRVNIMEDTFYFHNLTLMNMVKKNEELAVKYSKQGDNKEADKYWLRAQELYNKIDENSKIFEDAYNLLDHSGEKPDPTEAIMTEPDDHTGNVEVPSDQTIQLKDGHSFEIDRNPQSDRSLEESGGPGGSSGNFPGYLKSPSVISPEVSSGGGGNSGGNIGLGLYGAGAAAAAGMSMLGGDQPQQKNSPKLKELIMMSPEELSKQPDSPEKDTALEIQKKWNNREPQGKIDTSNLTEDQKKSLTKIRSMGDRGRLIEGGLQQRAVDYMRWFEEGKISKEQYEKLVELSNKDWQEAQKLGGTMESAPVDGKVGGQSLMDQQEMYREAEPSSGPQRKDLIPMTPKERLNEMIQKHPLGPDGRSFDLDELNNIAKEGGGRSIASEEATGMLEPGNIDMSHRPKVKNKDGSTSTVLSMSFWMDGKEVLVPKISELGKVMTDREAIEEYLKTGKNLGTFKDAKSATEFAKKLHLKEEGKLK